MPQHIPPLPGPVFDFIARAGKPHTIRGRFTSLAGAPLGASVRPRDVRMEALQYFMLPEPDPTGGRWAWPVNMPTEDNYNARYDRLVAANGMELRQAVRLATGRLAADLSFSLSWPELVAPDRSPYIAARRVVESAIDPADPQLYRLTTVRRVVVVQGFVRLSDPASAYVHPSPMPLFVEFWGTDTERVLPPTAPHWQLQMPG